MKKIISIITIILLVVGCKNDFVDKLPTQSNVSEAFYTTPTNATQAITAIYNMNLQDDWWSSFLMSEVASDDCAGGAGSTDGGGYQLWDRGLQAPGANGNNQNLWDIYFGAIYRANVYLKYEGNINWTGKESLRLQYQGEARFLRAYFHFYLAKIYGEIPFLDHTPLPTEFPGRTPAADLYAKIIADLQFAAQNCISGQYGSFTSDWGRATKWAAEAMLGRVFLYYTGYYNQTGLSNCSATNASSAIDDVINNSGHALVDTFASLWRVPCVSVLGSIDNYEGEINPEVVWSTRFIYGRGVDTYQRMIGPRNTNVGPYGQGWGAIPVLPTLWDAYDSTDTRQKATILNWTTSGYTYNYLLNTQAQYTGYNSKKYELLAANGAAEGAAFGDWQTNCAEDYMVIRFADVLLMGAELHLNNGDNGTALTYVNKVRQRAFLNSNHNLVSVTMDDIFTERKLELACEGLRYFDILRKCKMGSSNPDANQLVNILTYHDPNDAANFSTDANSAETQFLNVDGNNFVAKKGLFQIPQNELDLMHGAIQQNPGFN